MSGEKGALDGPIRNNPRKGAKKKGGKITAIRG